jgi:hypothetical protein
MQLPLAKEDLPEKIRRFGDPAAPAPAKMMAAKGLVPVKGEELVTLLVQLTADPDGGVSTQAKQTLGGLPDGVLSAACGAVLHSAILDGLLIHVEGRRDLVELLAINRATSPETVARIARTCDERLCERIADDQERVLEAPIIIEALYKNRNTRMSTVDRLVELAARNGVVLEGIATFQAHVEAIRGELIPEPTDEPLPTDLDFVAALAHDAGEDVIDIDKVDGTETVKETALPLAKRLEDATVSEKLRATIIGGASARAILARDKNRVVAMAAMTSPSMTESEAARIAQSRHVNEEILRFIGSRREWLGNYEVKRALLFNPKTPIGISMKFLGHMRESDLRTIARSKNVQANLRSAAQQRVQQRGGKN